MDKTRVELRGEFLGFAERAVRELSPASFRLWFALTLLDEKIEDCRSLMSEQEFSSAMEELCEKHYLFRMDGDQDDREVQFLIPVYQDNIIVRRDGRWATIPTTP